MKMKDNLWLGYYSRPDVREEIVRFCRDRWIALHCLDEHGNLVFRRYMRWKPITIKDMRDLNKLFEHFKVRSIYATANIYRSINSAEDVYDLLNIYSCTPTWDIDSSIENWSETIKVSEIILSILEEMGLKDSVYIKWSGNGCHIHIHEGAISENLLSQYHPLDLAYATVEYVRRRLMTKLVENPIKRDIVVENKMDLTRVFTSPLSLHRKLDVACICMKPEDLKEFTPKWIEPGNFKHNPNWRDYVEGEADNLAVKAYRAVGGYPLKPRRRRRKTQPLDKQIMKWLNKIPK